MVDLHPAARDRLVKLLGMLGSEYDGERAAAALKTSDLIRQCGLTWADLLTSPPPSYYERNASAYGPVGSQSGPSPRAQTVRWVMQHLDALSEWERTFLRGISRRAHLSAKQCARLNEIVAKINAELREGAQ